MIFMSKGAEGDGDGNASMDSPTLPSNEALITLVDSSWRTVAAQ
jgi:hypothetical protein